MAHLGLPPPLLSLFSNAPVGPAACTHGLVQVGLVQLAPPEPVAYHNYRSFLISPAAVLDNSHRFPIAEIHPISSWWTVFLPVFFLAFPVIQRNLTAAGGFSSGIDRKYLNIK
ncbi:hypothetical protein KFK09_004479 [Dendrobium nobile]|uniref:Uncharacterized protein n=1 Tax=Dendrobium nobile TaxID=94219 RepID=A0A8T3C0S7_DENNO|nr:hypothetical protein KFK09_004479 [Dendrobium nobile]